jgi:hypothetical protein
MAMTNIAKLLKICIEGSIDPRRVESQMIGAERDGHNGGYFNKKRNSSFPRNYSTTRLTIFAAIAYLKPNG